MLTSSNGWVLNRRQAIILTIGSLVYYSIYGHSALKLQGSVHLVSAIFVQKGISTLDFPNFNVGLNFASSV